MNLREQKQALRQAMQDARKRLSDRARRGRAIHERLLQLDALAGASVVCSFVGFGDEVSTKELIAELLRRGQRVAVPRCRRDYLELYRIEGLNDLAPRTLGILEPTPAICADESRRLQPSDVTVFVVPGLAFTPTGNRLGYGRGYYDRTLEAAPSSKTIGIAFDVQIVSDVPMDTYDRPVQYVTTESRLFCP